MDGNFTKTQEIIQSALSELKQFSDCGVKFELCVGIQVYAELMQDQTNFIEYDGKAFYHTVPVIVRGDIDSREFILYVKDSIKFDKGV